MKNVLIIISILSFAQGATMLIEEKRRAVQVESDFNTLERHSQSILKDNEKEKEELMATIESVQRTALQSNKAAQKINMVLFGVSLIGIYLATRKNKVEPARIVNDEAAPRRD